MLLPQIPPRLPIVMSNAMPTARFELGARLFAIRHTMHTYGEYKPIAIGKRKKYVRP
jgi:hypothetical protein